MSSLKPQADVHPRREVRSFVRREGRTTPSQTRALETLWPKYGIEIDSTAPALLELNSLFGRDAPKVIEIGFGDGEALLHAARLEPGRDFLGIEVYTAGVGHCLLRLEEEGLSNVRVCQEDAVEVLEKCISDQSLDEIRLYFPDPWPKKKHHKRRIVQAKFTQLVVEKLKPGGRIHFATDWQPYAEWALEVLEAQAGLENIAGQHQYFPRPESRLVTKFEKRGQRLGHGSWDLMFTRV